MGCLWAVEEGFTTEVTEGHGGGERWEERAEEWMGKRCFDAARKEKTDREAGASLSISP